MSKQIYISIILFLSIIDHTVGQDFVTSKFDNKSLDSGAVGISDFDGDGNQDIFSVLGWVFNQFYIFSNDGSLPLNFSSQKALDKSSYNAVLDAVDMDGDGDKDILTVKNDKIIYLENNSTPGNFSFEVKDLQISYTTNSPILKASDMDGDGDLDIIVGDRGTGNVLIFYKNGSDYTEYKVDLIPPSPVDGKIYRMKISDLTGDSLPEIVIGCYQLPSKNGLVWYENFGSTFTKITLIEKKTNTDLQLFDFDNDGNMDIIEVGDQFSTATVNWWKNTGSSSLRFVKIELIKRNWYMSGISIVDVNKDGANDLIVGLNETFGVPGNMSLYYSDGNLVTPNFTPVEISTVKGNAISEIISKDMDNDGDIDFVLPGVNIWVENRLSISSNEVYETEKLKCFPNPVNNEIYFYLEESTEISVYDLNGQTVLKKVVEPSDYLDISLLNPGVYFAHFTKKKGQSNITKFVKQ